MNYLKAIIHAIKEERIRKQLSPKCYKCKSKKNLSLVPTIGVFHVCERCKEKGF